MDTDKNGLKERKYKRRQRERERERDGNTHRGGEKEKKWHEER